jgi:flagellar hook-associated protein 2
MTTTSSTSSTTSSAGAGLIQSMGVGSGLDIQSLVTQLVASERSAADSRISRETQTVNTSISALAALKGALSNFQSALANLKGTDPYQQMSAGSTDSTVFTASATSAAAAGSYGITVKQLAQPEQLISTPFTGGATAAVGTGTLQLTVGGKSFSVDVASGSNTLANIRDAINGAPDNAGVKATIIYGVSGAQLALTSANTGAANGITVGASGGDGGLAALAYTGTGDTHYTEAQQAQDAIIMVSGIEAHSANNVVTGAIDGVTMNLVSAKPGSTVTLNVTSNQSGVANNVQQLVAAYNSLESVFSSLGGYNSTSQSGGPMLGDWLLSDVKDQITSGMTGAVRGVSAGANALSSIGITTNSDGTLAVDSTKLNSALSTNGGAVAQLLGGTSGIATRLDSTLTTLLATTGSIASRSNDLTASQKQITKEQSDLDARMASVQTRYTAQFSALDALVAQYQSTASFLTSNFSTTSKTG